MTDPTLQIYLPAFMLVVTCLIVFWNRFRKTSKLTETLPTTKKIAEYNRLKKGSGHFWLIFSVFGVMIIIYSVIPEFYFLFVPLDIFHHPLINLVGLLIVKIAIIWIVVAQIHIDKELFKYSINFEKLSGMQLIRYSEKMLITGMLILFIGVFTTITNIIGLLLVSMSSVVYLKTFFSKTV
ncbi:hypothetical protein MM213_12485 [Belliella sp. R4-6]|uniref:Uncharacterized protein n=1 Tax=Belliella alkalica TaxID=1730871 RepID=A0ABS9VCY7_9BACT|nr:hypothetical protein [Belliella alkalica]MCH7414307.1 hypothetical protein [Belliella alkalica]